MNISFFSVFGDFSSSETFNNYENISSFDLESAGAGLVTCWYDLGAYDILMGVNG